MSDTLLIPGNAGQIECLLEHPKDVTAPEAAAIICHPHPLYGGAMDNKVVYILASTFRQLGVSTLRFNFRGVGQSGGAHDNGAGEADDVATLAEWLRNEYSLKSLWLAGYSFGGGIAIRARAAVAPNWMVLVAPAVSRGDMSAWPMDDIDSLVVQGKLDDIIDPDSVASWAQSQPRPPQMQYMDDADHFFHGDLTELREAVLQFAPALS